MDKKESKSQKNLIPQEHIENRIFFIREQKVMLDRDLAILYDVETKALNQAVKRNVKRFPSDFMFQLTREEATSLRSHFVTLKRGRHSKYAPYAFTEHGILMLSSVLNSQRAIQVNIQIMRTFTKLREMLASHVELRPYGFQFSSRDNTGCIAIMFSTSSSSSAFIRRSNKFTLSM